MTSTLMKVLRLTPIELAAVTAKSARAKARAYAPCHLYGYVGDDCVYMSYVREPSNKSYVATTRQNRMPKPNRFEVVRD